MASAPSTRRQTFDDSPGDLNLVPIMGIMCILIPILLFMFTYNDVTVQRVQAPRAGAPVRAKPGGPGEKKDLNLTVLVRTERGFELTWEGSLMGDNDRAAQLPLVPAPDASYCADPANPDRPYEQGCVLRSAGCLCYDFPGLYNQLVLRKRQFSTPQKPEERLNIAADSNIPWEIISRVIDAAECMRAQDSYDGFTSWRAAARRRGDSTSVPGHDEPVVFCEKLFPKVVFALVE